MKKIRQALKEKKGWKKILVAGMAVVIVALVLLVVFLEGQLTLISNQLSFLQDTLTVMQTDMGNLKSGIADTLKESNSMVEDYSIKVVEIDLKNKTYTVDIWIIPKEYTDTTTTSIYFGTKDFPLEFENYSYKGMATLPLDESFDGNTTILFSDGEKKTTEVLHGYEGFQNNLSNMLFAQLSEMPVIEKGNMKMAGELSYNLEGYGDFAFTNMDFVIEKNGQKVYSYDLLSGQVNPFTGVLDHTITGETVEGDVNEDEESKSEDEEDTNTEEESDDADTNKDDSENKDQMNEVDTIPGTQATLSLGLNMAIEPEDEIIVYVLAQTTEGLYLKYDVFHGITKALEEGEETVEGFEEDSVSLDPHYVVYDKNGGELVIK